MTDLQLPSTPKHLTCANLRSNEDDASEKGTVHESQSIGSVWLCLKSWNLVTTQSLSENDPISEIPVELNSEQQYATPQQISVPRRKLRPAPDGAMRQVCISALNCLSDNNMFRQTCREVGDRGQSVLSVMMLFWLIPVHNNIKQHMCLFYFQQPFFGTSLSILYYRLLCNWKKVLGIGVYTSENAQKGWKELAFWEQNIAGSFLNLIRKDSVSGSSIFFYCVFSKTCVKDGWGSKIGQV